MNKICRPKNGQGSRRVKLDMAGLGCVLGLGWRERNYFLLGLDFVLQRTMFSSFLLVRKHHLLD